MIRTESSKLHPEFDFAEAKRLFGAVAGDKLSGEFITSAHDYWSVETLRDRHQLRIGNEVPADIFLMGKGEPPDPATTKVGGTPVWPADQDWPIAADGSPLHFLAQFNFADSGDLVGDAIAERLLIVATDDPDQWMWEQDSLSFHWIDRRSQLVERPDIPSAIGSAGPFYGAIHRAIDYPDDEVFNAAYECGVSTGYLLPVLNAVKIGGAPSFTQDPVEFPSRFLCQLSSIQASPDVQFPWVNHPEPLPLFPRGDGIFAKGNCAVFGDMGNAYFFVDDDMNVSWHFDCG